MTDNSKEDNQPVRHYVGPPLDEMTNGERAFRQARFRGASITTCWIYGPGVDKPQLSHLIVTDESSADTKCT
jgi:hypothetical protein